MQSRQETIIQEYKRNFYKNYHSVVVPYWKTHEKDRRFAMFNFFSTAIVMLVVIFLCIKTAMGSTNRYVLICIPTIVIVAIYAGSSLMNKIRSNFIRKLKQGIVRDISQVFGNMFWTMNEALISDETLEVSELFGPYTHRTYDDSFWGEYKGVKFTICETHLILSSRNKNNKSLFKTVFKGVVVQFALNKQIKAKTVVSTRGDEHGRYDTLILQFIFLILLSIPFIIFTTNGDLMFLFVVLIVLTVAHLPLFIEMIKSKSNKKMPFSENEGWLELKLEDPEFRKKYRVFSTDQVEGRYLVTTAFMERFKRLQTAFGAKKAKCSMYNDSIMFAISTNKNLFEVGGLFTPLKNPKRMENFFNEITSIMRIIDQFKLDEKTGL